MDGFEWAENNLGADSPDALQARGLDVHFAPDVARDSEVVNLGDGRIDVFQDEEQRPRGGYYANWSDLARYCRERGLPLNQVNGQASVLPVGFDEAGNPLRHGAS